MPEVHRRGQEATCGFVLVWRLLWLVVVVMVCACVYVSMCVQGHVEAMINFGCHSLHAIHLIS